MPIRYGLLIAALGLILLSVASIRTSVLPFDISQECQKYHYAEQEYCSGYHVATIALANIFDFFNSHGAAINALATVAIAGFTLTLWWSTRRLWQSSNRSAAAAEKSIVESRRIGEAQTRAYLYVLRMDVEIDKKPRILPSVEEIDVTLHLNNAGATPAINVSYHCRAKASTRGKIKNFTPIESVHSQEFINNIPPHTEQKLDAQIVYGIGLGIREMKEAGRRYTRETPVEDIPIVIVEGLLFYDDIFGKTFCSQFAFWFDGEPPWQGEREYGGKNLPTMQGSIPLFQRIKSRDLYVQHGPDQ